MVTERTLAPNLPRLLEPERRTPRQMQLASTLCRYVEMAKLVAGRNAA